MYKAVEEEKEKEEEKREEGEVEEKEELKLYSTYSELVAPVVVATIRIEDETNLVTLELSRLWVYTCMRKFHVHTHSTVHVYSQLPLATDLSRSCHQMCV